jgi:hypothetical protein
MRKIIIAALTSIALAGCASSKVSSLPATSYSGPAIHTIAMAPSGGLLADAVAVELSAKGFRVIDTTATSNLLVRLDLTEVEVITPKGLSVLKGKGVDAVLSVRSSSTSDGNPQSASARLNSTDTGQLVAGATWQNGFGGRSGSIADRVMRKGLNEAAVEIASAIAQRTMK